MTLGKWILGSVIGVAVLGAVFFLLPVETCGTDCEGVSAETSEISGIDQIRHKHALAVAQNDLEHRIYYAYLGSLDGDNALSEDYIALFKAMPQERQGNIVSMLEGKPSTPEVKELLSRLRQQ